MTADLEEQIETLAGQIEAKEKELISLKQQWGACEVKDYTLQGPDGAVNLSAAFGDHQFMVLIHNMGHQ